jgi:hypothetical protein
MQIFGQVYTDKIVGEKNQELKDSLSTVKYPYALPIWGEKVAQKDTIFLTLPDFR